MRADVITPALNYEKLSFPLVGNLSFAVSEKDAGQAGMTVRVNAEF